MRLRSQWGWFANKNFSFKRAMPPWRQSCSETLFPMLLPLWLVFPKTMHHNHLGSIVLPHPNANKDNVHQFQQVGESFQTREIMQLFYRRPFIYLAMDWLSRHTKLCYKGVTNTPGKKYARTYTGLSVCHCNIIDKTHCCCYWDSYIYPSWRYYTHSRLLVWLAVP